MSAASAPVGGRRTATGGLRPRTRRIVVAVIVVVVLAAMVLSTRFVAPGSRLAEGEKAFSASAYGAKQFPVLQKYVSGKATDATELATALTADPASASKYGVAAEGGAGTVIPVRFTGVVGAVPASGYTPVTVAGLPAGTQVAVQFGPAITGTDLRDATGKIRLGSFENQIQYQDAATAINDRLKTVLTKAGAPDLEGKTVTVEGVFTLINPAQWNVTPATLTVEG